MRAPTLVLLVSPSLGIVDNWLPVLAAARERDATRTIVAVLPERRAALEVEADDVVVRLTDELVDRVVVRALDGSLLAAPSLVAAAALARLDRRGVGLLRLIDVVRWRLLRRPPTPGRSALVRRVLRAIAPRPVRAARVDLAALVGDDARLCYDLHVRGRDGVTDVLALLGPLPRFSLHHGIDVVDPTTTTPSRPASPREAALETRAYLFSELERPGYRALYELDDARMRVVGIPRHDGDWAARVAAASVAQHGTGHEGGAFLVSRPAGSRYLPAERRAQALADIHRVVCEEQGLHLVIRLHPKEVDDGSLTASLPRGSEGRTWSRTLAHPFHLARTARLAIVFHSGLIADLVHLGVPVIERLDVRGLVGPGLTDLPLDADGRPMFSQFRRHGMALGADDVDVLREHVARALTHPAEVLIEQRAAYDRVFAPPSGAIASIVDDLDRPGP